MAEEHNKSHEYEVAASDEAAVETKDRGMFDFLGKKKEEEKPQEEQIASEFEKVHVSEPEPKVEEVKEKKPSLLEKLHGSDSSSSSSSEEEDEAGEKTKKKRKGLKEKIKGKVSEKISGGEKKEEQAEDTTVPVEKCEEEVVHPDHPNQAEEKKGFLDKIKEKLPGQTKKTEEVPLPPPVAAESAAIEAPCHEGEAKEKKGIFEKIKEKLPGFHPKTEEEKKEKAEDAAH